jgi:hypothetical protein
VHGTGPNVGAAITGHPKIGTISFTGTVTGRKVAETCAPMFKRVSLELGGKNPNIIFAVADQEAAICSLRSFRESGAGLLCVRAYLSSVPPIKISSTALSRKRRSYDSAIRWATTDQEQSCRAAARQLKFWFDLAKGRRCYRPWRLGAGTNDRCRNRYFSSDRYHRSTGLISC